MHAGENRGDHAELISGRYKADLAIICDLIRLLKGDCI